jgi:hypothetical protein
MAVLSESFPVIPAVAAIFALIVHYRLVRLSGSGLFAYCLLMATTIAIAALAISVAPANQAAQAVTDIGILLAGALAYAASGWLLFAFSQADDARGR